MLQGMDLLNNVTTPQFAALYDFSEFSDGSGLALHDFHARMYDPATATWSVPDPAGQFSNPYLAMGNNPVVGVDPDGEFVNEFFAPPMVRALAIT